MNVPENSWAAEVTSMDVSSHGGDPGGAPAESLEHATGRPPAESLEHATGRGSAESLEHAIGDLRQALPILGVMVASSDGLPIAHQLPSEEEALRIAAMAATSVGLGRRVAESVGHGEFEESVIRGTNGYFVVYSAGADAVLAVMTPEKANLGLLHLEARRTAQRVARAIAQR